MSTKITLALAVVFALMAPAGAGAHVTLQPPEAAAGEFTALDVRVPNESGGLATTRVDVQFPPGFTFASYQPVPGWSVKVRMERLAKPIASQGRKITQQVARVTWTANSARAAIQPGQFIDFPIAMQIPGKAGGTLTFKALQTYGDSQVVRWTGAPGSSTEAPQVLVTNGDEATAAEDDETGSSESDDGSEGLAIAALIVGVLALLVAIAALARPRRQPEPKKETEETEAPPDPSP